MTSARTCSAMAHASKSRSKHLAAIDHSWDTEWPSCLPRIVSHAPGSMPSKGAPPIFPLKRQTFRIHRSAGLFATSSVGSVHSSKERIAYSSQLLLPTTSIRLQ